MNNQIDLSKAYAGQIAHLKNGAEYTIKSVKEAGRSYALILVGNQIWYYSKDGIFKDDATSINSPGFDISSLEDDYFVQAARLEGMIEAYDKLGGMIKHEFMREFLTEKNELRKQLRALNENN